MASSNRQSTAANDSENMPVTSEKFQEITKDAFDQLIKEIKVRITRSI